MDGRGGQTETPEAVSRESGTKLAAWLWGPQQHLVRARWSDGPAGTPKPAAIREPLILTPIEWLRRRRHRNGLAPWKEGAGLATRGATRVGAADRGGADRFPGGRQPRKWNWRRRRRLTWAVLERRAGTPN